MRKWRRQVRTMESLETRCVLAAPPAIEGIVFNDVNQDNVPAMDERLASVRVDLFVDDGDGRFHPDDDELVATTRTDAAGHYQFEHLDVNRAYFVVRPSQALPQVELPRVISQLVLPGRPATVIDEFRTRQTVSADPPPPSRAGSTLTLLDEREVIGAERDMEVQLLDGVGAIELRVNPFGLEDLLEFNNSPGTIGTRTITWDGMDSDSQQLARGLAGRDLTEGGNNQGIMMRGGVDAAGEGTVVEFRLYEGDPDRFSSARVTLPVTGGDATEFLYIDFDDFDGPVSPTKVDAIQVGIGGGSEGADGKIALIGAIGAKRVNFTQMATADLVVTKTNRTDALLPGQMVTYYIQVSNEGPNDVLGARLRDDLPESLVDVSFVSAARGGATGNSRAGDGNLDERLELPVGSAVEYVITAHVTESASTNVVNQVTISAPPTIRDPNLANNVARDDDLIGQGIDLAITKDDGQREIGIGDDVTYRITAINRGPLPVQDARVIDTFPESLSNVTFTSAGSEGTAGNTTAGSTNIDDLLTLPVNGTVTYVVTGRVNESAAGTLVNRVDIVPPPTFVELTPEDNTEIDVDLVRRDQADLSVTKTDGRTVVAPGEELTYTIVVSNAGPSPAADVTVTDIFPPELINIRYTAAATADVQGYRASGIGSIDDRLQMGPDSSIVYTVSATVRQQATDRLINSVRVGSEVPDPDPTDNEAIDTNSVVPTADLSVTKSDGRTAVQPGDVVTYTIAARNNGPSDAPLVRITDSFPEALRNVQYTRQMPDGSITTGTGAIDDGLPLAAGAEIVYRVTGTIDAAAAGNVINRVDVTPAESVSDPNTANNSATDVDTVGRAEVDLLLRKVADRPQAIAGEPIQFTLLIANVGQTLVANANLIESLPDELQEVRFHSETTGQVSGNTASGEGTPQDTLQIAPGATVVYTIDATVSADARGTLRNLAQIDIPGQTDRNPDNNIDLVVLPIESLADLAITKSDGTRQVSIGEQVQYTILVTNQGPSDARQVRVTDLVPSGLTDVQYTSVATGGAAGNTNSGEGAIDDLVDLPVGSTVRYVSIAQIAADSPGTIVNQVEVAITERGTTDPDLANNRAIDINELAGVMSLGSDPTSLVHASLDLPSQVDQYRWTAHSTGFAVVTAQFQQRNSDLALAIDDGTGQEIATVNSATDDERIVLPVVGQQDYFIRVFSGQEGAAGAYDLEVENFPLAAPHVVRMTPETDSGMMSDDDRTNHSRPKFLLQIDRSDPLAVQVPLLAPGGETAVDRLPRIAGIAVEGIATHADTGLSVRGFAVAIGGSDSLFIWSPSEEDALTDGVYSLQANLMIQDGTSRDGVPTIGRSQPSLPRSFVVDSTPPAKGAAPRLSSRSDSGTSDGDRVTNHRRLLLHGEAEPGAKVRIVDITSPLATEVVASTVAGADGQYSVETSLLTSGIHQFVVQLEDVAGNVSTGDDALRVEIDTQPPGTPRLNLSPDSDTGRSNVDDVTSQPQLTFTLTTSDVQRNDHLMATNLAYRLYVRSDGQNGTSAEEQLVYDSAADPSIPLERFMQGLTDLTLLTPTLATVPDGQYEFRLEVEDRAGNLSQSSLLPVIVDTTAPGGTMRLAPASDTGAAGDDHVTRLRQLVILGTGEVGATVRVMANGHLAGQGQIGTELLDGGRGTDQGEWEVTLEPLADGIYELVVRTEDLAGNVSLSDSLNVEIDTRAPNTPYLDLFQASDSGRSDDDNVTREEELLFFVSSSDRDAGTHRTLVPEGQNFAFRLYVRPEGGGEILLYDSTTDESLENRADGLIASESLFTPPLTFPEGTHNLKAEVEDRAGNVSPDFFLSLTVDRTPPGGSGRLHPDSDTGIRSIPRTLEDGITSDFTPRFTGTAEANTIVTLLIDGLPAGTTVAIPEDGDDATGSSPAHDGVWSIDASSPLADGDHMVAFQFEDAAGNIATDTTAITVDTQAPSLGDLTVELPSGRTLLGAKPTSAPDPLINRLIISFSDDGNDSNPIDSSMFESQVLHQEGLFQVIGDATGLATISGIELLAEGDVPNNQSPRIAVHFEAALADDRYTLLVSPAWQDWAGNHAMAGPSGSLVARFTVDSRPEIGTWSAGSTYIDTNGNWTFDPDNTDEGNRDIVYRMGFTSDDVFAGNFALFPDDRADGFDKLAVYGRAEDRFRWLVDTDNDSVPNIDRVDPFQANGLPVAGRFDPSDGNGDEVGLFDGTFWYFDTDHDFRTDTSLRSHLVGYPIVGDFDGDGFDDLATWSDNRFMIDLAKGQRRGWDGVVDQVFGFGFIGVRERPVAADMDNDGIDDVGLWVPDREGVADREQAEWYFILSNGRSLQRRFSPADDPIDSKPVIDFTPYPFGPDRFAQFGDQFALPVVGNFDPPLSGPLSSSSTDDGSINEPTDDTSLLPESPLDINADGQVSPLDALLVINELNATSERDRSSVNTGTTLDVNGDGHISPVDALLILNELNSQGRQPNEAVAAAPIDLVFADSAADLAAALDDDWNSTPNER